MATLPVDTVPVADQTNQRVTQLAVNTRLTITYVKRQMQEVVDRQKLVTKAIQEDLKSGGFLQFINPDDIQQLVLLSDPDKVILDGLLAGSVISRLISIENSLVTINNTLTTLNGRVTTLEGFHP